MAPAPILLQAAQPAAAEAPTPPATPLEELLSMLGGGIGLAPSGAAIPGAPPGAEVAPQAEATPSAPVAVAPNAEAESAGAAGIGAPAAFGGLSELIGSFAGTAAGGLATEVSGAVGMLATAVPVELFGPERGTHEEEAQPSGIPAASEAPEEAEAPASTAGARHVDERDLIASVHRRLLVERERMGGLGALMR